MKKLNIALIGQGRSGRDIHGVYFKSEKNIYFNVVAVVERDETDNFSFSSAKLIKEKKYGRTYIEIYANK